jgi:hypothetical protein
MQIQLSKTIEARTAIITDVVFYSSIIDSQDYKNVITEVTLAYNENGYPITKQLVLWEGEAYDAIGQWTDEQAEARIKELLESE